MSVVGFTGHRKFPIPDAREYLSKLIRAYLVTNKPDKCISGMAIGFDSYCAEVCVGLKIPFVAAVPFLGQENFWPDKQKKYYREMLNLAEKVVIVTEGPYAAWKMQKRNEYIVNNSDIILTAFDGSTGGTKNCLQYAKSSGKKVDYIELPKGNTES